MSKITQLFQINWKVRVKNPAWWVQIIVAAAIAVLSYYGLNHEDMTSWGSVFNVIVQAFQNPYVVVMMIVSIINISIDPTSSGVSDSAKAMNYSAPNNTKSQEAEAAAEEEAAKRIILGTDMGGTTETVDETVATASEESDDDNSDSSAVG